MQDERAQLPLLLGAAGALGIAGAVGVALAPALLTYSPLLLIALAPLGRHMVLAAPITDFVPFLLVGTLRRLVTCVLAYLVGRAYGEAGVLWVQTRYPRAGRLLRGFERLFRRAGPVFVLLTPGPIVCALAGVTRMRWPLFLPLATVGQMGWIAITHRIGGALQQWLMPILAWLQTHTLSATLACVFFVVLWRTLRRGQRGAPLPSPGEGIPRP